MVICFHFPIWEIVFLGRAAKTTAEGAQRSLQLAAAFSETVTWERTSYQGKLASPRGNPVFPWCFQGNSVWSAVVSAAWRAISVEMERGGDCHGLRSFPSTGRRPEAFRLEGGVCIHHRQV